MTDRKQTVFRINQSLPGHDAPVSELAFNFAVQSMFLDDTINTLTDPSFAILPAPKNKAIIESTSTTSQESGYALALSADSECPVAVQFNSGEQKSASSVVILLPGQIIRPYGIPSDGSRGSFGGFTYGLPFGWLGGGVGRILVFKTPDSSTFIPTSGPRELLIHRITLAINTSQTRPNWPARFPWKNAQSQIFVNTDTGALSVATAARAQGNNPSIVTRPTRTVMTLQSANLPTGATSGSVLVTIAAAPPAGGNNIAGTAIVSTDFVEFPLMPGASNTMSSVQNSDQELVNAMFGDDAILSLLDNGDASLDGVQVNISRYALVG